MTQPPSGIGAVALADLLGHWPAADGPLYRLLATRIARLADTGELPAGPYPASRSRSRIRRSPACWTRCTGRAPA